MPTSRDELSIVTDARAAAILLNEDERRLLALFLRDPRTVSDVAATLDRPRIAVLYRVRKLVANGLLRVARVEPRAGRPIKHYQASARRFVVPYAASRAASAAEFVEQLEGTMRRAYFESFLPEDYARRIGIEVGPGDDGTNPSIGLVVEEEGAWRRLHPSETESVNTIQVVLLYLPKDRAEALRRDLLSVLDRYRALEVEGTPPHLVRLGFVKLRE